MTVGKSCTPSLKLVVAQLVKKLLAFYGRQWFITVSTKTRHWSHPERDLSYIKNKFNFLTGMRQKLHTANLTTKQNTFGTPSK
jgi:hypothetical protein